MANRRQSQGASEKITIERTYEASAEEVFALWTTKQGIESWWAPDGFKVDVQEIEPEPGGHLAYTMTATGTEQVEFMKNAGMPLTNQAHKTFTEVVPAQRLAYDSVVDFVPGIEAYEFSTLVELQPVDGGVHAVMTIEPMHDEVWTQRLIMGRENELENLAKLIAKRGHVS